jgi:hypothetical protein
MSVIGIEVIDLHVDSVGVNSRLGTTRLSLRLVYHKFTVECFPDQMRPESGIRVCRHVRISLRVR